MGEEIEYMEKIGSNEIMDKEEELSDYENERIGRIKRLRILGNEKEKGEII